MGQAWMVAEGLGLPHRLRAAAVTALTGFQSAMTLSTAGMRWVGTSPLETMANYSVRYAHSTQEYSW
jgi:hypothetical protein